MISSYRFALLAASMSTAVALSACQPTTEDTESAPTEEVMPPPVEVPETDTTEEMDAHAGHEMVEDDMIADDAQMTDMLKDYTKSMSKMHDVMMIGMGYNDPDTAFAKSMLGHHRGAVDMANIELKYGTDADMRQLAQEIIHTQQTEIDIMRKWLASHPDASRPKPATPEMQQAYADGMNAMHGDMMIGIADPVPDMAFARGMLPHHVGAVDMAKIELKYGTDEEMRKLAQEIIDAQQPEIERMQSWIATHGADSSNNDSVSPDIADSYSEPKETVEAAKAEKPSA